jgi:hypothetical protein
MLSAIRPTTAADARSVVGLLNGAGLHPNAAPQDLQWKYWQPRADWSGPRSFVLVDGNDPIAHAALIPGSCVWQEQRIKVIHLIDWAARAEAIGAGTALLKHIALEAQALLAIGGSATTQQILPEIGFRPAGVVKGYVRTLFPLRLLQEGDIPIGRRLPRFTRSVVWTLTAPSRRNTDWQARPLASGDLERIALLFPRPVRGMAVLERSVELFRYLLACPILPMALFAVESSGRLRGYLLLASAPGQVRIADCWIDSEDAADWRSMILCAVEQAKHDRQAAEVVIWANGPLLTGSVAACGFHARYEFPIWLRATDAAPLPPVPLRVQMLDSDAAFLHHGRNEHWA